MTEPDRNVTRVWYGNPDDLLSGRGEVVDLYADVAIESTEPSEPFGTAIVPSAHVYQNDVSVEDVVNHDELMRLFPMRQTRMVYTQPCPAVGCDAFITMDAVLDTIQTDVPRYNLTGNITKESWERFVDHIRKNHPEIEVKE